MKQCEADLVNMATLQQPSLAYEPTTDVVYDYDKPLQGFLCTRENTTTEEEDSDSFNAFRARVLLHPLVAVTAIPKKDRDFSALVPAARLGWYGRWNGRGIRVGFGFVFRVRFGIRGGRGHLGFFSKRGRGRRRRHRHGMGFFPKALPHKQS